MKNRWMAYAIAAALGLGIAGEALAQAPGGAPPPAPPGPPAVQKREAPPGKTARKGKKTRRHRGKKGRGKRTGAARPATPQAQSSAPQTR